MSDRWKNSGLRRLLKATGPAPVFYIFVIILVSVSLMFTADAAMWWVVLLIGLVIVPALFTLTFLAIAYMDWKWEKWMSDD